jgi:hypothetical protein
MNKKLSEKLKKMLVAFLITGVVAGSGCGFAYEDGLYIDDLFGSDTVIINSDYYNSRQFDYNDFTDFGRTIQKYDEIENIYVKYGRNREAIKWYSILKDGKASKENEIKFEEVLSKIKNNQNLDKLLKEKMQEKCEDIKRHSFDSGGYEWAVEYIEIEKNIINKIILEKPELSEFDEIITYLDECEVGIKEIKEILTHFYEKRATIVELLDEDAFQFSFEYIEVGEELLDNDGYDDYSLLEYISNVMQLTMEDSMNYDRTGLDKVLNYLEGLKKEREKFDDFMSKEGEKVSENK